MRFPADTYSRHGFLELIVRVIRHVNKLFQVISTPCSALGISAWWWFCEGALCATSRATWPIAASP
jgi:hypothetical protein